MSRLYNMLELHKSIILKGDKREGEREMNPRYWIERGIPLSFIKTLLFSRFQIRGKTTLILLSQAFMAHPDTFSSFASQGILVHQLQYALLLVLLHYSTLSSLKRYQSLIPG